MNTYAPRNQCRSKRQVRKKEKEESPGAKATSVSQLLISHQITIYEASKQYTTTYVSRDVTEWGQDLTEDV
jgi:hypothetical protein